MADTLVDGTTDTASDIVHCPWGPYWTDVSIAVLVYIDAANDLQYARTTDKGANWSVTEIEVGNTLSVACWFDKETTGDTGDVVHVGWLDRDDNEAKYVTIDVGTNTLGTVRTVASSSPFLHRRRLSATNLRTTLRPPGQTSRMFTRRRQRRTTASYSLPT